MSGAFPSNLSYFGSNFTSNSLAGGSFSGGFDALAEIIALFGFVAGGVIILGGVMVNSDRPGRRKLGGILEVAMVLVGGLPTLGGFVIGSILAGIGAYLGLTYRPNAGATVIGLGPVGSVAPGQQTALVNAPPARDR